MYFNAGAGEGNVNASGGDVTFVGGAGAGNVSASGGDVTFTAGASASLAAGSSSRSISSLTYAPLNSVSGLVSNRSFSIQSKRQGVPCTLWEQSSSRPITAHQLTVTGHADTEFKG